MKASNICIIIIMSLLAACNFTSNAQINNISNQELVDLMEKEELQLVDVRTPEEVSEGYIAGAENIDFRSPGFKTAIGKLDRNKPIAVYCGSGGRSGKTSQLLLELGFEEIYDLSGGFTEWKEENHPVKMPQ